MADVAALGAAHEAGLPDRVGREVVVVHVPAVGLEREVVDALTLLGGAEREQAHDLRLAAREETRAVRARRNADLTRDRADLVRPAAVRAALLDRDLAADELLVDRLRGPLDELPGQRVLDRRRLAVDRRRPDREGQVDRLDDPVEQELALGRLELLRVLLGLGQRAQVVLELLAHRAFDRLQANPVEDEVQRGANLHPAGDVLLCRLHRQRRAQLVRQLLDDRAGLTQPLLGDALPDHAAVLLLELAHELHVEPLRLADLAGELLLRLADLDDLGMGELEGLEQHILGDLVGAGLDHRQAVLRADDDQVERALVLDRVQRRVDDELAVDHPDANGADRPRERQRRRSSAPSTPR